MSKPKITITGKDLDTEEKSEAFSELFGLSKYYEAMPQLSVKSLGDGTLEHIQDTMGKLNPQLKEDEQKYETLQVRMNKESARLVEPKDATFDIEINDTLRQRLFEKRDKAKQLLGEARYFDAIFPNGAKADRKTLRNYNPHLDNKSNQSRKDSHNPGDKS